jgi:hypothetical protein
VCVGMATRFARAARDSARARLQTNQGLATGARPVDRHLQAHPQLSPRGFRPAAVAAHPGRGDISTNIVEGCGAPSNKEFARYLGMSIDSANETEYHLLTSRDLSLIKPDDWRKYTAETIEVRKMVYGYRVKVLSDEQLPGDEARGGTLNDDLTPPPAKAPQRAERKGSAEC